MAGIEPATATLAGRARSLAVTPTGRLPRSRFGLPLWCSRYGCVKNQACTQGSQGRQESNPHFSGFGDRLPIRWLIPKKMKPPRGDFPGAVACTCLLALTQQPLHRSGQHRAARPGSSTRLVSASAMSSYIHRRSSSRRGQLYFLTAAGNTVRLESYSHIMSHYFAFVALVAVLVLIPGPAVILVMHKAVTTGCRGALRGAAGVLAADLVWAAAAAAGVSAVIVASEPAFLALRFAGAAYLVYLGARLLLAPGTSCCQRPRTASPWTRRRGFWPGPGNAKTGILGVTPGNLWTNCGSVVHRPVDNRRDVRTTGGMLWATCGHGKN